MKNLLFFIVLAGLLVSCVMQLPDAIDREAKFEENKRFARCAKHGDWQEQLPWCREAQVAAAR
jgi:hypothetical protein